MEASVCIEQKGVVEEITDHKIKVRTHRDSACGQCNARGICILGDDSGRIIETGYDDQDLKVGDNVGITITRSMGNKAVILGYLIPFVLFITVLILLNAMDVKEWLTGLLSIAVLVPYFMLLFLFRERLSKTFTFTVRKKEL